MNDSPYDLVFTPKQEIAGRIIDLALKLSAVFFPLLAAIIIVQVALRDSVNLITFALSLYCLSFPLLWLLRKKLTLNVRGITFLGLLMLAAFMVQLRGGLTASPAALQIIVLLLSGLIFGTKGLLVSLALSLLSFALAALLVTNNLVPPVSDAMWNPQLVDTWIRSGFILAVFGGAAALFVIHAFSRLEKETTRLQESLQREKSQRIELERVEREKELAQQALIEAQRIEALGRLASGVAHDFNNSLTIITGAAEIADMDPNLPPGAKKALSTIKNAAFKSADLTRSLMVLGRKDPTQLEVIRTDQLIFDIKDSLERLIPEDISFTIEDLVEREGCSRQWRQNFY